MKKKIIYSFFGTIVLFVCFLSFGNQDDKNYYDKLDRCITDRIGNIPISLADLKDKKDLVIIGPNPRCLEGLKLPKFSVTDLHGNHYANHSFNNQEKTLVNFWFIECHPCVEELDEIQDIYNNDYQVISFCLNSHDELVKFVKEKQINFPIIPSSEFIIDDVFKLNIFGFPTNLIVDSEGIVLSIHRSIDRKSDAYKSVMAEIRE